MAAPTMLNKDLDMIEQMETHLAELCRVAFQANDIEGKIYGIFSVDDLEEQREADICRQENVAVGVGYRGCSPRERAQGNVDNATQRTMMVDFVFLVLLVVPAKASCLSRMTATKLLTVLRLGILGQRVWSDKVQRTWEFVEEAPNIAESNEDLLYYSQVWRLSLTNTTR